MLPNENKKQVGLSLFVCSPNISGVAHPTHKMRWRMFDKNTNLKYTYQEIWQTHSTVIEMLIELFDYDENKLPINVFNMNVKGNLRVLTWADEVMLKSGAKELHNLGYY